MKKAYIMISSFLCVLSVALWAGIMGGYKGCPETEISSADAAKVPIGTAASQPLTERYVPSAGRPVAPKKPVHTSASCLFCNFFAGKKSAHIYAQDADNLMFRSLSGGVLAIPKAHIESLKRLDEAAVDEVSSMILFASQKSRELPEFKNKYYNKAYFHTGSRAGQTVFHLHMHVRLSNSQSGCRPMGHAARLKKLTDNQYATLMQAQGDSTLYVQFKQPLGHLSDFDALASEKLTRGLLLASQYIRKNFPNSDYVTDIDNVCDGQAGEQTVEISIRLR